MNSTSRNFLIVFVVLITAASTVLFSKKADCSNSNYSLLVLLDFTDPIGPDAITTIKNHVWKTIENEDMPDYSKVILRPILGSDDKGGAIKRDSIEICRPKKPGIGDGFAGPATKIKEDWIAFKNQLCGSSNSNEDISCGDSNRKSTFFDSTYPHSVSSPIFEEVVDDFRLYLAEVESWHLIIASDWKQYTPPRLDLHTKTCSSGNSAQDAFNQLLIGKNEKIFTYGKPKSPNIVDRLFVQRSNMTQDEADCLDQVSDNLLMGSLSASPPPKFLSTRLPTSP
jgi:hypothetical protein